MTAIRTILYVEDSSYNLLLVKAILGPRADIRLVTAVTAAQGLALAPLNGVDLLLLDLNLPDMRGEDFLNQFRTLPGFDRVPVVIVSGESMSDRLDRLAQFGVAGILVKPFDIDHFEKVIDQLLAVSRADR